jgi:hypothetical protein
MGETPAQRALAPHSTHRPSLRVTSSVAPQFRRTDRSASARDAWSRWRADDGQSPDWPGRDPTSAGRDDRRARTTDRVMSRSRDYCFYLRDRLNTEARRREPPELDDEVRILTRGSCSWRVISSTRLAPTSPASINSLVSRHSRQGEASWDCSPKRMVRAKRHPRGVQRRPPGDATLINVTCLLNAIFDETLDWYSYQRLINELPDGTTVPEVMSSEAALV